MKKSKPLMSRRKQIALLRAECDRIDHERARERMKMLVEQRMNFLRVRLPGGGSAL